MRNILRVAIVLNIGLAACSSTSGPSTSATEAAAAATQAPATSEPTPAATEPVTAPVTEPTVADTIVAPPTPPADDTYSDPASWICRGDISDDPCDQPTDLTLIAGDGSLTVETSAAPGSASIDCFYVYPTISEDQTFNSDMVPGGELGAVALQANLFNQDCNVFAPMYRSVTVAGLFGSVKGNMAEGWALAYDDVLAAWRHYLAYDNGGRPVVLFSHSQGSFHLVRLLSEEIDPNADQRDLVVSAILAGTSFQVAPGKDVGGDTQHMPLCQTPDQFGCVITYQTFRDSDPPQQGALFGAPKAGTESACTNPAALQGGPAVLEGAYPAGAWAFADQATAPTLTTPFIDVPGLITGECKELNGYHYLAVTVNADPTDARADNIPGDGAPNWGLHTLDINIVGTSLVKLVHSQTAAYQAAH